MAKYELENKISFRIFLHITKLIGRLMLSIRKPFLTSNSFVLDLDEIN